VVHEVGDSGDPLRGDVEAVDEARLAARRRRHGDRVFVVDVESESDGDAATARLGERAGDEPRRRLLQIEVVERQVERLLGARDELAGVLGDLEGALAPVRQGAELDRQA
jgi:hypothetical protein